MTTWEYPVEAWQNVMRVNLDGPFMCCKAIVPGMIAQNYGRIVSIASVAGKEGNPNAPAYSASKAGVIALTKSLGKELASYDIGVNCVTPAAAKTAMFEQMTKSHIDYMLSKIPRGRFVTVDEIALSQLARWLLDQLGINPLAELSIVLLDADAMAALHQRWMGLAGPTDVMAFPRLSSFFARQNSSP